MLQTGLEFLARQQARHASRSVLHCREVACVCRLKGVCGPKPLVEQGGTGSLVVDFENTDWLFLADDLRLQGVAALPRRGDTITEEGTGGKRWVWEVRAPDGEQPYRVCDTKEKHLRVHAKLIERKGVCP